jgi:ribosome-binding protein aMBF1 (putative translation factor)
VSLSELVSELEGNPAIAQELSEARQSLAETFYRGEETLTALRLKAGLSQAKLASKVRTSQPHIWRIERGTTDPTTDMVVRLAAALGVPAERAFLAVRSSQQQAEGT